MLAPLVLTHFTKIVPTWTDPLLCNMVGAGSVLDVLPQTGFQGVVAGSGKLQATTHTDLRYAKVLGVRGRLTAADVKLTTFDRPNLVLGDPGLLANELTYVSRTEQIEIGVVPHWSDTELYPKEVAAAQRGGYIQPVLIDVAGDPLEVIAQIGSCKKIVASSLHGLIVADAFGIPRRAEQFPAMKTNKWEGGDFKFRDYASVLNQPIEWGVRQYAPRATVERIQYELFDMLRALPNAL